MTLEELDLVPEAVVVLDPDRVVLAVNDRALPLLGVGRDAVGRPLGDVLAMFDEQGRACPDPLPAPVGDRVAELLLSVRLSDGRRRHVAMAGRWRPDGGCVVTFRAAGRRAAMDRVQADVVATVSHEIRSPLTSVKGFTRTLLGRWERFSDEQKRTMLETINEDTDRVTRLLQELLEVSRIDAGRVELALEPVDVPALASSVAQKASIRPDGINREVVVTVEEGTPRSLRCDRDKVEQALTNLVDNALRYAPSSEVRVRLAADPGEGGLRVDVEDDGPGVPADQQTAIFRKFGRGREVRRSGTGLGLYITRGLAIAHGGDVLLESVEGEGSRFTLVLPDAPLVAPTPD